MHETRIAIGLDVGGTKIAGGVVTEDGHVLEHRRVSTPAIDGDATVKAIEELVGVLRGRHPSVAAIGVGAAGMVEWPEGIVRYSPNHAYVSLPLRRRLQELAGLPTVVDNDANAAAWAEATFGAGAGSRHLVLLTVGTGIGGGLVLDGELYRGAEGFGAELGHLLVNPEGPLCVCGNRGCFEAMASGTALQRMGRLAIEDDPSGRLAGLAPTPDRLTSEMVADAARHGDPVAVELFSQFGYWLGVGVASLVALFDPQVVVVGGGLVQAHGLFAQALQTSFERHVFGRSHRHLPPLVPARLELHAGVVGAATLALHLNPPPR